MSHVSLPKYGVSHARFVPWPPPDGEVAGLGGAGLTEQTAGLKPSAPARHLQIAVTERVDLSVYLFLRRLLELYGRRPVSVEVEFREVRECFDSGVAAMIALDRLSEAWGFPCTVRDPENAVAPRARERTPHIAWEVEQHH